jgi:hypothetical protein
VDDLHMGGDSYVVNDLHVKISPEPPLSEGVPHATIADEGGTAGYSSSCKPHLSHLPWMTCRQMVLDLHIMNDLHMVVDLRMNTSPAPPPTAGVPPSAGEGETTAAGDGYTRRGGGDTRRGGERGAGRG